MKGGYKRGKMEGKRGAQAQERATCQHFDPSMRRTCCGVYPVHTEADTSAPKSLSSHHYCSQLTPKYTTENT